MFLLTENIYYIWMGYLPALAAAAEVALPATVAAFAVDSTAAAETVPKPLGPASADEVVVEVVALFIYWTAKFTHSLQG